MRHASLILLERNCGSASFRDDPVFTSPVFISQALHRDVCGPQGQGLVISFGFQSSPFGEALIMVTDHGLIGLAFGDGAMDRDAILNDMRDRWPEAVYKFAPDCIRSWTEHLFDPLYGFGSACRQKKPPLRVMLLATDFRIRVWKELLHIPPGRVASYSDIAERLGVPRAVRAVGAAVGSNPVSFVIPCHRVIGKSGAMTGYHWGLARKRTMLAWEAILVRSRVTTELLSQRPSNPC